MGQRGGKKWEGKGKGKSKKRKENFWLVGAGVGVGEIKRREKNGVGDAPSPTHNLAINGRSNSITRKKITPLAYLSSCNMGQ